MTEENDILKEIIKTLREIADKLENLIQKIKSRLTV